MMKRLTAAVVAATLGFSALGSAPAAKADEPYWQSYIVFIVTDDRPVDVLLQCSDNTWQAYNLWPDDYSLYTDPKGR